MKYLYSSICLLLVLLCSCNKEGDITVVVEDGQPTIEVMILGKWQPTVRSWVNLETGEIYSQEPVSGDDLLEFFEDGTCGFSGDKMNWRADNEDFSVYLDGEYWDIASLTERLMRLYREGKPEDKGYVPNGWLVYDFDRIGNFEHEEEEGEPDATVSHRIASITESHSGYATKDETVYTFRYDKEGRISTWAIDGDDVAAYVYDGGEVFVSADAHYRATLNSDGYAETVRRSYTTSTIWETVATIKYNANGQMSVFNDNLIIYNSGDRQYSGKYNCSYSEIRNQAIPDLNYFISSNGFEDGLSIGYYSLLFPFKILGEPSMHLIEEENYSNADFYYRYEYELDKQDRVTRVIRSSINRFNEELLNTTTYTITYE